jgi:hypothetical protein
MVVIARVIRAEDLPPVLTGKPNEVEILRRVDAEALAKRGYFPSSQSYVEGRWSGWVWVLAVVLILLFGSGSLFSSTSWPSSRPAR